MEVNDLIKKLGMQPDEAAKLFSEETLRLMRMLVPAIEDRQNPQNRCHNGSCTQPLNQNSCTDGSCSNYRCVNGECPPYPPDGRQTVCSDDTCTNGECSVITPPPTPPPTLSPDGAWSSFRHCPIDPTQKGCTYGTCFSPEE